MAISVLCELFYFDLFYPRPFQNHLHNIFWGGVWVTCIVVFAVSDFAKSGGAIVFDCDLHVYFLSCDRFEQSIKFVPVFLGYEATRR